MTPKKSHAARAYDPAPAPPVAPPPAEQAPDIGGPVGSIQQLIAARLAGHAASPVILPRTLDRIDTAIETLSRGAGWACLVATTGTIAYLLFA